MPDVFCEAADASDDRDDEGVRLRCCVCLEDEALGADGAKYEPCTVV